jgi:hypothetical protein
MDTQLAYEGMRAYLTRPGARPAVDINADGFWDSCYYEKDFDGEVHRCAVGCLLSPEALAELEREGALTSGFEGAHDKSAALRRDLAGVDKRFLLDAQIIHDSSENWEDGKFDPIALDVLAAENGLKIVTDVTTIEEVPVGYAVGV